MQNEEKRAFYEGHKGTTFSHLALLVSTSPISVALLLAIIAYQQNKKSHSSSSSLLSSFLIDYLSLIVPTLASVTWAENYWHFVICLILAVIFILWRLSPPPRSLQEKAWENLNSGRKDFLSSYRASMMIQTVIAILAVDFPLFPRSLAKTETFGCGLMDVGVGSFVVSLALVSARSPQQSSASSQRGLKEALWRASPMILLWAGRLLTVKATDYYEHVSEYGVHWNFFATLAVVSVSTSVIHLPPNSSIFAGLGLLFVYQSLLSFTSLSDWMISAPRVDLFSANREGIIGCVGYISLFLVARGLGSIINQQRSKTEWKQFGAKLSLVNIAVWIAAVFLDSFVQETSRRLMNAPYVLFTLSLNLLMILLFAFFHLLLPSSPSSSPSPSLIEAVNANSLAIFLIGNLMTGAVNLSMDTIHSSNATAIFVLSLYTFLLTGLATVVHSRGIRLKWW